MALAKRNEIKSQKGQKYWITMTIVVENRRPTYLATTDESTEVGSDMKMTSLVGSLCSVPRRETKTTHQRQRGRASCERSWRHSTRQGVPTRRSGRRSWKRSKRTVVVKSWGGCLETVRIILATYLKIWTTPVFDHISVFLQQGNSKYRRNGFCSEKLEAWHKIREYLQNFCVDGHTSK